MPDANIQPHIAYRVERKRPDGKTEFLARVNPNTGRDYWTTDPAKAVNYSTRHLAELMGQDIGDVKPIRHK